MSSFDSESGIKYPVLALVGVKQTSPRTREAEADRCVVVVTVYREEASVGDLPERADQVQRPADRVRRHQDLSRFALNVSRRGYALDTESTIRLEFEPS